MKSKRVNSRSGFTLLEIMLVVVIIGMLITVAVVRLSGESEKARLVATRHQIDAYKTALGLYDLDNGMFPTTEQGLNALISQPPNLPNWKGPYLDPPVIRKDQWGHDFIYRYPGQKIPSGFDLFSVGPNGVEGDEDDIGNWQ
ncbi:MAG TPA: type II secretion system major pseudopilin GspG [Verrucomicrobiae bacterium]|nr:type II secretion system major pseudopilin GspG [Verrucomicrobiae bacterium]